MRDRPPWHWEPEGERLSRWRRWNLEISAGAAAMGLSYLEFSDLSLNERRDLPAVVEGWRCHELVSCWLENHTTHATRDKDIDDPFGYFQVLTLAENKRTLSLSDFLPSNILDGQP